jgi:flagellar biosynthesis/type III secretory pathway protein FliH
LDSQREPIEQQFNQLATAKIVADPDISPGGCRVVTDYGVIDQQIESQLARIEQEAIM